MLPGELCAYGVKNCREINLPNSCGEATNNGLGRNFLGVRGIASQSLAMTMKWEGDCFAEPRNDDKMGGGLLRRASE